MHATLAQRPRRYSVLKEDGAGPTTTTSASNGKGDDASPSPSAEASSPLLPRAVRHHISFLERRRYYAALASRLPLRTLLAAAAAWLFDTLRAKGLLLVHVNAGGLPLLYEMVLESARPEMRAALEVVLGAAEGARPIMFFCKAGKDRTGGCGWVRPCLLPCGEMCLLCH